MSEKDDDSFDGLLEEFKNSGQGRKLKALFDEMSKNAVLPVTFPNEEAALEYAAMLARLAPGSVIATRSPGGEEEAGVLMEITDSSARMLQFSPALKQLVAVSVPISCVHLPSANGPRQ